MSAAVFSRLLLAAAALALGMLIVWKALVMGITHDEAGTYLNYVEARTLAEALFTPDENTNNHLLNTLLVKFTTLFGQTEFFLRIPNVVAGLAYVGLAAWWSERLSASAWVRIAAFGLLTLNPYLIEFFSVARGYGLSLAGMLFSLWFFVRYLETGRPRCWTGALVAAALALYAQFTQLHYLAALILTYQLFWWLDHPAERTPMAWLRHNRMTALVLAVLIPVVALPFYQVTRMDVPGYGGYGGFRHDTIGTLLSNFLYGKYVFFPPFDLQGLLEILVFALMIAGALAAFRFLRRRSPELRPLAALFFITASCALSVIAQFEVFNVPILFHRTALFFYPLAGLLAAYLLRWSQGRPRLRPAAQAFALIFTGFLLWNFVTAFRPDQCREWAYERDTKRVMRRVEAAHPDGPVRLGMYWHYLPAHIYYTRTGQFTRIEPMAWRGDVDTAGRYDYYYVPEEQRKMMEGRYELVEKYTEGYLYRWKGK
jgi:hypothetical protein